MSDRQRKQVSEMLERLRPRLSTGPMTDTLSRLGLDGWMDGVLPMRPDTRVVGFARTVRYAPRRGVDAYSKSFYEIIRECSPGEILVIESSGTNTSVFGGNMAACGDVQGLAAIITDGRCRDYGDSSKLKMGVFCLGPTVRLPFTQREIVAQDVPITCGGAQVSPGDLVIGDIDGVVVVPSSKLEQALIEVEDIMGLEEEIAKLIAKAGPISELQALLKRKKIRKTPA